MTDLTPTPSAVEVDQLRNKAQADIERIEAHQDLRERSTLHGVTWLGLLMTLGLIALGWGFAFYEMWHRWFPVWKRTNMTLSDRLTEGDSYYTHGPLVPLTCILVAVFIYFRIGAPILKSRSATVAGWLILLTFVLFHLASALSRVTFVSGFALIGVLLGLLLIWGGWALARAYALPVLFLAFMVPLPEVMIGDLNFRLKFLASSGALWITNHIFQIPAYANGSYVFLGDGKVLVVENVCGGLRSLISLVWFASLFAMVCRVRGLWRLVLLVLAVPVAVVSNVARITCLNVGAYYLTVADVAPGSAIHDLSGLAVFAVALAFMFASEQAILWVGKRLNRPWSDKRLLGYLDYLRDASFHRVNQFKPMLQPTAVLTVSAALTVFWATRPVVQNLSHQAQNAVPQTVMLGSTVYDGADLPLDQKSLDILETNDYLYRHFTDAQDPRYIDLLIVFSPDNRKGTHPPEVCIEGGGDQIIAKKIEHLTVEGVGDLSMRELVTQRGPHQMYFLYTYKAGGRYTANFYEQQFWIILNGMLGRNTAGALIRLSVPILDQDEDRARSTALAAARALMPQINQNLP